MLLVVACGSDPDAGQGDTSAAPTDVTGGKPSREAHGGTSRAAPKTNGDGGADSNDATAPDEEKPDAEGEADGAELPPGWTPNSLVPLAWYFASPSDVIDEAGVRQWSDRSGNGRHLTQTFQPGRPELAAVGTGTERTVRFNGGQLMRLETWTGSPAGTNVGFTVLAVMRSAVAQNAGIASWWSEWGDGVWANIRSTSGGACTTPPDGGCLTLLDFHKLDDGRTTQMYAGNQDLGTVPHVVAWRFSPSTQTVTLTVDGVHAVSNPQPPLGDIGSMPLIVGATSPLPTALFKGDISELVIVPTDISDTKIQHFTEYAQDTWDSLPTSAGGGPCIKADGQPSPDAIRCDDGNSETFGDHCSAGSCVGTVPGPGSPKDLSPVAWYHAGEPEVVITYGGVSTWFDRSSEHRDLLNGYVGRPAFDADGWNGDDPDPNKRKPTVTFAGVNAIKRQGWTGPPTGTESAFSVLAVLRPAVTSQSSGVVAWWNPDAYGQASCRLKASGSATALDLFRYDNSAVTQEVAGSIDLGILRHAVAWRYANGAAKFTVDGVTQTQQQSPIGTIEPNDWFLMGVANGLPTGPFNGDISELAVIPRSISDTEVANFTAYAEEEWGGLTIACTPDCADKALGDEDGCGGNCGCDLSAPFDAPVAAFTGSMDADGLAFSADGLTAYISGAGPGNRDIYVATRSSPDGTFGTPALVAAINTPAIERAPSLSPDGKLYFTKQSNGLLDIGRAVGTAPLFTGAEVVPAPISSSVQDEDPFWWGNNALYFVSEVDNGSHREIWVATLSGTTFLPTKVQGQDLNSPYEEFRPVVSPDGLTLYFGSRRFGIGSDTSGDIWMARRSSTDAAFLPPINLWGMNTTGIDYPVTVAANGCTLYFASNEETGLAASENFRLYKATRGTGTPAQVTLRLNILGQGSVTTPPFNCGPGNTGTCSASAPPDATMILMASSLAQWTGSCTGNGSTPSTDGVVVFSQNAVCTVKFPGAGLVGQGGPCSLSMDCAQGLPCVNNVCGGCDPGAPPDDMNSCTADACDPVTGVSHTPLPEGTSCTLSGGADGICDGAGTCEQRTAGDCNGNGARTPTEECDDGVGSEADLCSATCRVADALAVRGAAGGESRYLGESRHPVSAGPHGFGVTFLEPDSEPPVIGLSVFDSAGDPRARLSVSSSSLPMLFASPAVAALEDGSYAVAWTDFGQDGDELGVALRRVIPETSSGGPPVSGADLDAALAPLQFANGTTNFSQYDADVLRVGNQLVVAWTDTSDATTAPDIRYRAFQVGTSGSQARFRASGAEQPLADTSEFEGNVALAPFGETWVAAFRSSYLAAEETIEVLVPSAGMRWSIGPHLPGAPEDRPAVAELDAEHLAVLFSVGADAQGPDGSSPSRLRLAVLSLSDPEPLSDVPFVPDDEDYADPSIAQSHPSLVRAGSALYASWRAASLFANPEAENVFLRELSWTTEILAATEYRIPRTASGSLGDQRFPALAVGPQQLGTPGLPNPAPQGSLVVAWDDYGSQFGSAQGRPDVLVQFWPLPVLRIDELASSELMLPFDPQPNACRLDPNAAVCFPEGP